ncbi:hypothetical protein [Streptosporangium carneum]|nr:hypothetical protein [Streptosporangium carneum]
MVTNAIVHSDSGHRPYGSVTVCVALSVDHPDQAAEPDQRG